MEFRRGVCSSCGAQFKVPASFQADQAKCKKCGGVVEIGAVEGAASSSEPPTAPMPEKAPVKQPVPAKAPVARPKPQPATKPVAKPAAPKAKAGSSRSRASSGRASAESSSGSGRSSSRRSSGSSSRSRSGRGSSSRSGRGRSEESSSRGRRGGGGRGQKKEKNWGLVLGMLALFVAIAGGGAWWFVNKDAGTQAAEGTEVAQADGAADTAADEPIETSAETPAEDGDADGATDGDADAAAAEEPEPEPEPAPKKEKSPDDIDLSVYDWEKFVDTSDDEWTQINEWADSFFDPWASARDLTKAKEGLKANARGAFPAILNRYNQLDVTTEEGADQALRVQKDLLQDICNGQNFGWKDGNEPADQYYNKRVIELWNKSWAQAATGDDSSDIAWANLTKQDIADVKKERGVTQEQLDELDSLDDF